MGEAPSFSSANSPPLNSPKLSHFSPDVECDWSSRRIFKMATQCTRCHPRDWWQDVRQGKWIRLLKRSPVLEFLLLSFFSFRRRRGEDVEDGGFFRFFFLFFYKEIFDVTIYIYIYISNVEEKLERLFVCYNLRFGWMNRMDTRGRQVFVLLFWSEKCFVYRDNEQGHRENSKFELIFLESVFSFVNDLYRTRAWSPLSRSAAIIPCKNG